MNLLNKTIFNRYEIINEIDRGAMGIVFKAKDKTLDRFVAVKQLILHPILDEKSRETHIERFVREAKSVAKFSHPNIVSVFDTGKFHKDYYIVMEYVEGKTLEYFMNKGNPLSVNEVIEISIQALEALGQAHKNGVVHRDIKPSNIMLLPSGRVKVMDFGIAKAMDMGTLTSTGATLGTIGYMSPEQWDSTKIDGRSDLFSYSVMMYQMLAGERPFKSESIATFVANLVSESFHPDPIRQKNELVPHEMEKIIMKGLERDREKRYQKAEEMIRDLEDLKKQILLNPEIGGGKTIDYESETVEEKTSDIPQRKVIEEIPQYNDGEAFEDLLTTMEEKKSEAPRSPVPLILFIIIGFALVSYWVMNFTSFGKKEGKEKPTHSPVRKAAPSKPAPVVTDGGQVLFRTDLRGTVIKVYGSNGKLYRKLNGIELKAGKLDMPPGSYTIKVTRHNYYEMVKKNIDISKGQVYVLDFQWRKKPSITIASNIDNAQVLINNTFKGYTKNKGFHISNLKAGSYLVTVQKPGYNTERVRIKLGESAQQGVMIKLQKTGGSPELPSIGSTKTYPTAKPATVTTHSTPKSSPTPEPSPKETTPKATRSPNPDGVRRPYPPPLDGPPPPHPFPPPRREGE